MKINVQPSFKEKFEPVFKNKLSRSARKEAEAQKERPPQTQTKKSSEAESADAQPKDKMANAI